MVLLLLVSAVPFALADEDVEASGAVLITADSGEDVVDSRHKPRRMIRDAVKDPRDAKKLAKHVVRNAKQLQHQVRAVDPQKRAAFARLKQDLRACDGDITETCVDARNKAKEHLLTLADRVLNLLDRLEERVRNADVDADFAERFLAELAAHEDAVASVVSDIEALGDDATLQDYRDAAQKIKGVWHDVQRDLKVGIGKFYSHRFDGLVAKADRADAKMQDMIAQAEEKGYDVTGLESHHEDFVAAVAAAKESLSLAKEADGADAHPYIREAHASLQEAHRAMKAFMEELRGLAA